MAQGRVGRQGKVEKDTKEAGSAGQVPDLPSRKDGKGPGRAKGDRGRISLEPST